MGLAIVACLLVILVISASIQITFFVALCVLLVDIFVAALMFYWNLTLSSFSMLCVIMAIG